MCLLIEKMEKIEEKKVETYDSDKDIDDMGEDLSQIMDKMLPYKRSIMIIGIIIVIMLVVFLGYAYGGLKVCSDLDGLLDDKFKCHPNYEPPTRDNLTNVGQRFVLPNTTLK